jgi:hypothetical protein
VNIPSVSFLGPQDREGRDKGNEWYIYPYSPLRARVGTELFLLQDSLLLLLPGRRKVNPYKEKCIPFPCAFKAG